MIRLERKLLADIAGTVGAKLALVPLVLASSIVIARVLEPEGRGIYATVLTIAELTMLLGSIGVAKAAIYHVARARAGDADIRVAAFRLSIANGAAVTAMLVGLAFLLPRWLPGVPTETLLLAAPLGVVALLRGLWEGFLRGEQRNHAVNGAAVAFATLFVAMVGGAWIVDALSTEVAVALRVASVTVAAALVAVLVRRRGTGLGGGRFRTSSARALVGYGIPYAAIGVLQNASYRLDILLVQGFLGSAAVGHYSIAVSFGEMLWYLPAAVGFVLLPRVAGGSGAAETATLARWTFALTALAACCLGVAAEPLIGLLYGEAYLPAVAPLRLLLVGLVANVWYQVLSGYLLGRGRLKGLVGVTGVGLAVNVALNVVLIPRLGIGGAALASSVSYTVTGLLVLALFKWHGGIGMRSLFVPARGGTA